MYLSPPQEGDSHLMKRLRMEIQPAHITHPERENAIAEIRKVHHHIWDIHIKKLLEYYTIKEIIAGSIIKGVFYPSYEIGKEYYCKKPLTPLRLWQPRKKNQ